MKIGIIGNGFVGKATKILGCKNVELIVYDIVPELCVPLGINLKEDVIMPLLKNSFNKRVD